MKLTRSQIIDLFNALTALRGEPTPSMDERGKPTTIYVPYPLSDRVRWCAAENRHILKKHVIAHEEVMQDKKIEIDAFKKKAIREAKHEDPKVQSAKMQEAQEAIQDLVDGANQSAREAGREEIDVTGLRLMPAKGFFRKGSNLPPTIIGDLMVLIDGEPHFDDEAKPDGAKE